MSDALTVPTQDRLLVCGPVGRPVQVSSLTRFVGIPHTMGTGMLVTSVVNIRRRCPMLESVESMT
jgi:hypothetical protein